MLGLELGGGGGVGGGGGACVVGTVARRGLHLSARVSERIEEEGVGRSELDFKF